jgi:hypothetical protein
MVECPDDSFANPIQADDGVPFDGAERRIDRSEEERRLQSHAIEPLSDDAGSERVKIEEDVGQFWHGVATPERGRVPKPPPTLSVLESGR